LLARHERMAFLAMLSRVTVVSISSFLALRLAARLPSRHSGLDQLV